MKSLKHELISGVFYTAIAKYSGVFVQLFIGAVLARSLPPSDFGVLAIASVLSTFFFLVSDFGLGPAIIQDKVLNRIDLHILFTSTILGGSLLGVLFYFCSPIFANIYHNSSLLVVCEWLSITLFLNIALIVPRASLIKKKSFAFIAFSALIIQISSGLFSIFCVYKGSGVLGLVWGGIYSSFALFCIYESKAQLRPTLCLSLKPIKQIFHFSVFQFLSNFIIYFSRSIDTLIVGKYLGTYNLGFYEKSYRLMMMPLQNITQVITPVLHPILRDFQNQKDEMLSHYTKVVRILALIGFPLSVFIFFNSRELILIVYGNQWKPAIEVFQILSISVGFQIVYASCESLFQALSNTRGLLYSGVISLLMMLTAISVGVFYFGTIAWVAKLLVIAFAGNFLVHFYFLISRSFHSSQLKFYRILIPSLLVSSSMAIALQLIESVVSGLSNVISLALKSIISLLVFAITTRLFGEDKVLLQLIKKSR